MKLSGYTYVKNAVEMNYPFEASIRSMLDCCDEVVVIDASTVEDGTSKALLELVREFPENLNVYEYAEIDWTAANHGIWDGKLKAIARSQCSGDFLFQLDSDEIIEENARPKIDHLLGQLNQLQSVPIVAIPIVEYWGSSGKVRIDVNPWKWRISKNDPNITHGIPANLRKLDPQSGLLYALQGTDGCDYIYEDSGQVVPFANFMNNDVEVLRRHAVLDESTAQTYEQWFNIVTTELPTIYHYSWWSVYQKIKKYDKYWNAHWISLYGDKRPQGWNPFFEGKSLNDVTDQEMIDMARKLESETSGHIFHTAWTGTKTNSVTINKPMPKWIVKWAEENKTP